MAPSYTRRRRTMNDAEIVAAWLTHRDAMAVAMMAGVNDDTVRTIVKAAGHKLVNQRKAWRKPLKLSDAEICRRYKAGARVEDIARDAGGTDAQVYYRLKANGVERRRSAFTPK